MRVRVAVLLCISSSLVSGLFSTCVASSDSLHTDQSTSCNNKRIHYLIATEGIAYAGAMTALYTTW
ncbi:MAG: hypothetical protein ACKORE_02130, partial [Bacteroidota bacterium]